MFLHYSVYTLHNLLSIVASGHFSGFRTCACEPTDAISFIKFCGNWRLPYAIIIKLTVDEVTTHNMYCVVRAMSNYIGHRGKFMVFKYTKLQYGKQPPSRNKNVISESCVFMVEFLLFRFLEEIIFFLRSTLRLHHSFYYHSSDVAASSGAVLESSLLGL